MCIRDSIHTTADFEYADSLVFSDRAVERGLKALKAGAHIVTAVSYTHLDVYKRQVQALETGIAVAGEMSRRGFTLLGSGEMGIGNTTTSSAVLSVLLEQPPSRVTGRGAGLDTTSYRRKISVIEEGIRLRCPDKGDGVDVLSKVGGLDLACLLYSSRT